MTALIYVVIIVAIITYLTMFNINSLAHGFGEIYDTKKKHVVRAMKRDRNKSWKVRAHRFEAFRPKYDNPEPSEWYIPLYALLHPAAVLGLGQKATAAASGGAHAGSERAAGSGSGGFARLFRKRKQKLEELEEPQPWVIE